MVRLWELPSRRRLRDRGVHSGEPYGNIRWTDNWRIRVNSCVIRSRLHGKPGRLRGYLFWRHSRRMCLHGCWSGHWLRLEGEASRCCDDSSAVWSHFTRHTETTARTVQVSILPEHHLPCRGGDWPAEMQRLSFSPAQLHTGKQMTGGARLK